MARTGSEKLNFSEKVFVVYLLGLCPLTDYVRSRSFSGAVDSVSLVPLVPTLYVSFSGSTPENSQPVPFLNPRKEFCTTLR